MYSTIEEIRTETGFNDNDNITDEFLEGYGLQANGILNGYIGSIYNISKLTGSLFVGSQAEQLLKRIELLFACGYVLINQYGPEDGGLNRGGDEKIKLAESLCNSILVGDIRLFDNQGNEFLKSGLKTGTLSFTQDINNTPFFKTTDKY